VSRHAYPELPAGFIPLDDLLRAHRDTKAFIGARRFCRKNPGAHGPSVSARWLIARAARGGSS
jgi:hypothetical protein